MLTLFDSITPVGALLWVFLTTRGHPAAATGKRLASLWRRNRNIRLLQQNKKGNETHKV